LTDRGESKGSRAVEDIQQTIQTKYPFLHYATTNVLMHSNRAQSIGVAQNAFITTFPLQHWIKLSNLFEKFLARHYTNKASLLYILAERDCSSLIKIHPRAPDHFDIHGERYAYPFIVAVARRNEDAVRELVRAVLPNRSDALLHLRDNLDRFPRGREFQYGKDDGLFSFVVDFNHEGIFRYFLETHTVEADSKDKNRRTPLSWAAERGREVVTNLLLARSDVEIDSKDNSGRTPLSWAAGNGHKAVVKLLLEKGAELESKDNAGRTPLSWAVSERWRERVVKLLLEKGAELESKDDSGRTPLSWAAGTWSSEDAMVKLLLEKGAELESKDDSGRTPLSWATERAKNAPSVLE
jgi:ankyrin repeat protein